VLHISKQAPIDHETTNVEDSDANTDLTPKLSFRTGLRFEKIVNDFLKNPDMQRERNNILNH